MMIKFLIYVFALCCYFHVNGQITQTYGDPSVSEGNYCVTADGDGFMYSGGFSGGDGLLVKTDNVGNVVWSKTLELNLSNSYLALVSALNIEADTLFGCGFINNVSPANTVSGCFYFKMNKNTGDIYWLKIENSSNFYLSAMTYDNGRYFLLGAEKTSNSVYDGLVVCVSSTTGDYIWQSNTFGLVFPAFNNDYIDDMMGMTEVVNGTFYITGRSYINSTPYNMRPTLIGFDINGNMILNKYLLEDESVSGNNRYYGMGITFDGLDELVIAYFGDDNCTGSCVNYTLGILKTDLNGNVIFSNNYDVIGSSGELLKSINVTDDAYVIGGTANYSNANAKFISMKVDKNGVFDKIVSVSKPGTINQFSIGGQNFEGSSKFINGVHYFPSSVHSGNPNLLDFFMVQLDEDLNSTNPCIDVELMNVNTIPVAPFSADLVPIPKGNSLIPPTDGSGNIDYNIPLPCDISDISYNQTTYGCDSVMIYIVSASGIAYDITWSSGDTGFNATFYSSDSVIIEYYNPTNCCFMTDTIDFQLGASTLDFNMPNDTTFCIDPGGTFLIEPVITDCNGCDIIWSDNSTDSTLLVSSSGWYSVEVSNSCGVVLLDSIFVELNLNPTISAINDTVVCSSDFPLTYNFSGNNVDSILWSNGDTNFSTTYLDSGSMQVVAYSQCGNLTENFSISIPDNFTLDMPNDTALCLDSGGAFLIEPIITNCNGCDILWSDNSTNPTLLVSATGWYSIEVSNPCGYLLEDSILVELNLNPTISSITDTVVCSSDFPLTYNFVGSNVDSILWSNGDTNLSTTYLDSGSMQVVAYSQCGNLAENFSISISGNFTLDMPNDTTLCINSGEIFLIEPVITNCNGCDIIWSDNSTNPALVVSATGWYSIEVSNACDFVLEGSVFVSDTCTDLQPEVVVPNVFTPNGDASNPFFTLRTVNITRLELVIINRWGNVMYSANQDLTHLNSFIGWDGRTSSGGEAKEGTYFYIYKAITYDEGQLEGHGFLQLVRN